MKNAVKYAYEAIANPMEGTMISVIKDWAEYIYQLKDHIEDFLKMLVNGLIKAMESLNSTTTKMAVLSKAGVVDAGAKGFVVFWRACSITLKTGRKQWLSMPTAFRLRRPTMPSDTTTSRFAIAPRP